ncbi:MAG: hypothetical protein E5W38_18580 [Mesorhizobium sp.]|nr:MAG: hypothetical protein E5W38_18580 [Mesorhizobium sp.]
MRLEIRNALVETYCPAAGNQAIPISLRTFAERAKPTKVTVAVGFEQEHVALMADEADADACLECLPQRGGACATQFAEPVLRIDP